MNNTSIIIPTHNRHRYLDRSVDWFIKGGYRVIIADSSTEHWRSSLVDNPHVKYIHMPGSFNVYVDKINAALAEVKTPLTALCADDDFIFYDGVEKCSEFLLNNDDYSFCQGYVYSFHIVEKKTVVWPMLYDGRDISSSSSTDRILEAKNTVFYGVNRTKILSEVFLFLDKVALARDMTGIGCIDFAFTTIVAEKGKIKNLDIPFSIRQYSADVSAVGTRPRLIVDSNLTSFYQKLLNKIKDGKTISSGVEDMIIRAFASDFSGQIQYDMLPHTSRRGRVMFLPNKMRQWLEIFVFRSKVLKNFPWGCMRMLRLFGCKGYPLFKRQIVEHKI